VFYFTVVANRKDHAETQITVFRVLAAISNTLKQIRHITQLYGVKDTDS